RLNRVQGGEIGRRGRTRHVSGASGVDGDGVGLTKIVAAQVGGVDQGQSRAAPVQLAYKRVIGAAWRRCKGASGGGEIIRVSVARQVDVAVGVDGEAIGLVRRNSRAAQKGGIGKDRIDDQ